MVTAREREFGVAAITDVARLEENARGTTWAVTLCPRCRAENKKPFISGGLIERCGARWMIVCACAYRYEAIQPGKS